MDKHFSKQERKFGKGGIVKSFTDIDKLDLGGKVVYEAKQTDAKPVVSAIEISQTQEKNDEFHIEESLEEASEYFRKEEPTLAGAESLGAAAATREAVKGDAVEDPFPKESRAGFKIIRPTENEPDQKYSNILKTKRFNDKGDELYIQEYNEGKIKCFVTEKGKKPSPIILSQSQFDDVLKKYARMDETTRRIIPVNAAEKESVDHESEEQDFEKILGKEIIDKIIARTQKFKENILENLKNDETWKKYKEGTRKNILEVAVEETIGQMLDVINRKKMLPKEFDKKEFLDSVLTKI